MPILGTIASSYAQTTSGYSFIATTVLGSDTRTITFSSIPQTYKHLELRIFAKSDFAGGVGGGTFAYTTFAGSDASYGLNQLWGQSTSGVVSAGTDWTGYTGAPLERLSNGSDNANTFGLVVAIIPNYTNTNMLHSSRSFGGFNKGESSGQGYGSLYQNSSMYFTNTNAVTAISIVPGDGGASTKFKANSTFTLYGIG